MPKKRHILSSVDKDSFSEQSIIDTINKSFGGDTLAYTLGGLTTPPSLVTDWVSTGLDLLDIAISNKKGGGYPVGRVIEIMGLESTGKSLLVAYALKKTQDSGGIAILLDTESAADLRFYKAIGLNIDLLIYMQPDCIEDCFQIIEAVVDQIRSVNRTVKVTLALDSVMASPTRKEIFGEIEVSGYDAGKALFISKAMRKLPNLLSKQNITLIFTNQLRADFNSPFGEKYKTSGGLAIAFHSSVRILLKKVGEIVKGGEVTGIDVEATIIKNKVAIPLRKVNFPIMFQSGVGNSESIFKFLLNKGIVTKDKKGEYSFLSVDKATGEVLEEQKISSDVDHIKKETPYIWEEIEERMLEYLIIDYQNEK